MNEKDVVQLDYKSNSHTSKKEKEIDNKKEKVQKITSGSVVRKKKGLGSKISETFFGDDVESVSSYVIHDVIIPAAKNMISDTVTNGIEMLLFGQVRGSRTKRDKNRSYVSYNGYYNDRNSQKERTASNRNRNMHNFDDIVLETRGEAEEVLSHLVDLVEDFGMASVADLYDLVGITSKFTDNKYGWDNLSSASVNRVRDGYLLKLPRTMVLE